MTVSIRNENEILVRHKGKSVIVKFDNLCDIPHTASGLPQIVVDFKNICYIINHDKENSAGGIIEVCPPKVITEVIGEKKCTDLI